MLTVELQFCFVIVMRSVMRAVMPHAVGEEEYSPLLTAGEIGEKMPSGDTRAVGILAERRQTCHSGTVAVVILTPAFSFEMRVAQ